MQQSGKTPLVSILMPCFRGSNYIREALDSCLAQTYPHFEVVCVDDKSPDDSLAIMREYAARDSRVKVFTRETNGGLGAAFETALSHSTGDYLTRLAHDDLLVPDALRVLVEALNDHPEVALVYGDMEQIDPDGKFLYKMITEEPEHALMPRNRVGLYVMWRASVHEHGVGYTPESATEDYDLWLQISLDHKLFKVQAPPGLLFRLHPGQESMKTERVTRWGMIAQLRYNKTLARRNPLRLRLHWKVLKGVIRYGLHRMRHAKM